MDSAAAGGADSLKNLIQSGKTGLPVLFVQLGKNTSLFFDRVLKQAALSNGIENVFILTDVKFELYTGYNCIDINQYIAQNTEFESVYRHHSTNGYIFEKACFDRWFIINFLVKETGLDHFIHADCDVMIFEDLKPVYNKYIKDKYDGTMMFYTGDKPENSITSSHTSFWNAKLLNDFCEFTLAKYRDAEGFEKLLQETLSGKFLDNFNVSDMILLDVFRTEAKTNTLNLISLEEDGMGFDLNANISFSSWKYSYVMDKQTHIKKMTRRSDGFYGQVEGSASAPVWVKFYTLHFQGYLTKTLIPMHTAKKHLMAYAADQLTGYYTFFKRRNKLRKNELKQKLKKVIGK